MQATEVPQETEPPERLLGNDETPQGLLHPLGDRGTSVLARGGATTAGETTVEERDATTVRAEVEATINVETMPLVEDRIGHAARPGTVTGEVRALGAEASSRLNGAGGSVEARTEAGEEVGEFRALEPDCRRVGRCFVGQGGLRRQRCRCLGRSNGQQQRAP